MSLWLWFAASVLWWAHFVNFCQEAKYCRGPHRSREMSPIGPSASAECFVRIPARTTRTHVLIWQLTWKIIRLWNLVECSTGKKKGLNRFSRSRPRADHPRSSNSGLGGVHLKIISILSRGSWTCDFDLQSVLQMFVPTLPNSTKLPSLCWTVNFLNKEKSSGWNMRTKREEQRFWSHGALDELCGLSETK